jgi:DNA adenine methylase
MKEVKTNLRWAGGKSKMIKILDEFFPKEVDKYIETFTGGGSVLLHIVQKYNPKVVFANDIDGMLINYYNQIKNDPQTVINECLDLKNNHTCETFAEKFYTLDRNKASHFFTSNKTSFSGLNRNYSIQAYDRNFSINCINKIQNVSEVIQNVNFINDNFVNLEGIVGDIEGYFIYLDPPYFGNKDKGLYGEKGVLHKEFNHLELFEWVKKHSSKNKIMLSYDDSPFIRELYKDYNIYSFDFVYSMTNTGGNTCKNGKEIVITNYELEKK